MAATGILVAANYRPTGMKPVVAKHRKKGFTALPREGYLTLVTDLILAALRNRLSMIGYALSPSPNPKPSLSPFMALTFVSP